MNVSDTNYMSRVIYKDNCIVIYFKSPMMEFGNHSCLNPYNYAICDRSNISNKSNYCIPLNQIISNVYEIVPGQCIKLIIDKKYSYLLKENNFLKSGFILLDQIRYIESANGIISNLNSDYVLGPNAADINISNGLIELSGKSELNYFYLGNNGFSPSLIASDFYVETSYGLYYPLSICHNSDIGTSLTITFENNVLNCIGKKHLKTVECPRSKDVFLNPILGNCSIAFGDDVAPFLSDEYKSYINILLQT